MMNFHLEVHPWIKRLYGPVGGVKPSKAVNKMGAKGWIDVFWCELATLRPVVGPSSPIADNLEKKEKMCNYYVYF